MENMKVVKFERNKYQQLCQEMKEILSLEKEVAAKKEELRKEIADLAGGDRMEYGIRVQFKTAKGSVDYKKLVTDCGIGEAKVESYRKADRSYCEIRSY